MALIHRATLTPTKLELLTAWLPGRAWAGTGEVDVVGTYRFDDPAGEVGIETFLLRAGDGRVLQVPVTYRGAPLDGADDALVGTTEHSVLGTRWVYDGCADPVWVAVVAAAALAGGTQAEERLTDGTLLVRETTVAVLGTGAPGAAVPSVGAVTVRDEAETTLSTTPGLEVRLARVVGAEVTGEETLGGSWAGGEPVVLAAVGRS